MVKPCIINTLHKSLGTYTCQIGTINLLIMIHVYVQFIDEWCGIIDGKQMSLPSVNNPISVSNWIIDIIEFNI